MATSDLGPGYYEIMGRRKQNLFYSHISLFKDLPRDTAFIDNITNAYGSHLIIYKWDA